MKHEMLKKLMEMKGKKLSPVEQKAKMSVLEQLKSDMSDMMGDKIDGMKKVTVASPDKEGLEHGLAQAKEMIHGGSNPDSYLPGEEQEAEDSEENDEKDNEGSPEHEASESPEMEAAEHESDDNESEEPSDEHESEDELDQKIQELMKKKEALKKSY